MAMDCVVCTRTTGPWAVPHQFHPRTGSPPLVTPRDKSRPTQVGRSGRTTRGY